jgi:chorismate mutase
VPDAELDALRAQMDALNTRLRDVLQERARLAGRIADHKHAAGLPMVDAPREDAMLARLLKDSGEGFDRATLEVLLRSVFAASRALVVARHHGA